MIRPSDDDVAREGLDALRATSDARERSPLPTLVEVAGGEPIVYDDEPEGAPDRGIQHKRPKRRS